MLHLHSMEALKEIIFKVLDFVFIHSVPILVVAAIIGAVVAISLDVIDKVKVRRVKKQEYYNQHKEEIEARRLKRKETVKDTLMTILAIIIGLIMLGIFFSDKNERGSHYEEDWHEYYLDRPDKF